MQSKTLGVIFSALALALLSLSGSAFYATVPHTESTSTTAAFSYSQAPAHALSLFIEPHSGMTPLKQLIASASSSIDLVMYEFEDQSIEQLLAQKAAQGISVRVILDNGYFGGGNQHTEIAYDYLRSHGVQVAWSSSRFALTHEKSLVIDNATAVIMTFNLTPKYYASDRDFGIIDTDQIDVAAMESTFAADFSGKSSAAQNGDDLVWSPGSKEAILDLINGAQHSLEIYNEEMQDPDIMSALENAAERGVQVEVVMTYASSWKDAFTQLAHAGVQVRTYKASAPLYIHAKMIVADDARAFVGSENFSESSLDKNRELGIVLSDPDILAQLKNTFAGDFHAATPFTAK